MNRKTKEARWQRLETAREAYNTFYDDIAVPAIGIDHDSREYDKISFVETAYLIQDRKMRELYCEKSIEMLKANIDVFKLDYTPVAPRHARVVCFTLIAPAVVLYVSYPMWLALLVASLIYYVTDVAYRDDLDQFKRLQADWEENYLSTIATYEKSIGEIDEIRWKSTLIPLNPTKDEAA